MSEVIHNDTLELPVDNQLPIDAERHLFYHNETAAPHHKKLAWEPIWTMYTSEITQKL